MRPPIIPREARPVRAASGHMRRRERHHERGVTLLLVAVALVAIIGMAALAIDVVTLYLAREEAQRAADTAAIAGARVLSLTGATGDPNNTDVNGTSNSPWVAACNLATQVAQAVAQQNTVNSGSGTATVTFLYNGTSTDCNVSAAAAFTLNPQVQVQVVRNGIPSLFSRIWNSASSTISATATAEAYNPSDSGTYTSTGDIVPVAPRCVKPWVIPNIDPLNPTATIVAVRGGTITTPGVQLNPGTTSGAGIIGETFNLGNACGGSTDCTKLSGTTPVNSSGSTTYAPALISTSTSPIAVPSCANGSNFQQAVGGCDVATSYACGTFHGAQLDYTINPASDTQTAADCVIRAGSGLDAIDTTGYPFQIKAGAGNPYASTGQALTASSSIVTLPIFNNEIRPGRGLPPTNEWPQAGGNNQPTITIVGFLQVFINFAPDSTGGFGSVTVLNVVGCGDGFGVPAGTPVDGSSPVPIRLITPP